MSKRYEVLLRRGNGYNKTVIIEDCLSDREAMETAEAMYGMEALRAIWKPDHSSSSSSGSNWSSSTNSDGGSILGLLGLAVVGGVIIIAVQFWWLILIVAAIVGGLWILGESLPDDD